MIKNFQNHFQTYIINSEKTASDDIILNQIASSGSVTPITGLNIYYKAYRLRLIEILSSDFPKLKKMLGENEFETLAVEYIDNFPSKFSSVRHFGQDFPNFLKTHSEYRQKAYFAEMAAFEWILGDTLDAADASLETLGTLKSIAATEWHHLKLNFHPSFRTIQLFWNVPQIWQSIEYDEEHIPQYTKAAKPILWIMVRSNLQCAFRSAEENEAYVLELGLNGNTFGEICEKLCDKMAEEKVPYFALGCLQNWIKEAFISSFSQPFQTGDLVA